jgi:hypothetical protein
VVGIIVASRANVYTFAHLLVGGHAPNPLEHRASLCGWSLRDKKSPLQQERKKTISLVSDDQFL